MSALYTDHLFWRLHPDNFTPPARTPWGGTKILDRYKRDLSLTTRHPLVGESWEISVEPTFPSRIVGTTETLAERIALDPVKALGATTAKRYGGLPVLVKLLDAREALSVQVHPSDEFAELKPNESGKPESWIVLDREPGAGLFLGFKPGVDRKAVEQALHTEAALDQLMCFVPVEPGDVFEIAAGTAHAIGAGVTLVEPQLVQPGKLGVTYRFWDWNRRYDGKPRPLHVSESLAVTQFDRPAESTRRKGTVLQTTPRWVRYIDDGRYRADVIEGSGEVVLNDDLGIAIVVAKGTLTIGGETLRMGESAFLPAAAAKGATLQLDAAFVVLTCGIA